MRSRSFWLTYWRSIAASVVVVVVGIMAISILTAKPSFSIDSSGVELSCPAMADGVSGDLYNPYSYGQQISGLTDEHYDQMLADSQLDTLTGDEAGRAYLRIDANLASICSDLKASQQGLLIATLGFGVLLLAFLAVPFGRRREAS